MQLRMTLHVFDGLVMSVTIHHHQGCELAHPRWIAPRWQPLCRVIAQNQKQLAVVTGERFQRVDGVGRTFAPNLDIARSATRNVRKCRSHHCVTIRRGGAYRTPLLPRITGNNKEHPVETETRAHRLRDRDVTIVYRVECTAEHAKTLHVVQPTSSQSPIPGRSRSLAHYPYKHTESDTMTDMTQSPLHVVVRVLLPDRPGALGLVASRIAAAQGDIVSVDVLERSGAVAVDEFRVDLPNADLVALLIREIEAVEGAAVEEAREVDAFPDPLIDAISSAEVLVAAADQHELFDALARVVLSEFAAEWAALAVPDAVAATAGTCPESPQLMALRAGVVASPAVASGEAGPADLLVAPLSGLDATLLVSRTGRPFRQVERAQCCGLARIADQLALRMS
jgi:hypothetical protein